MRAAHFKLKLYCSWILRHILVRQIAQQIVFSASLGFFTALFSLLPSAVSLTIWCYCVKFQIYFSLGLSCSRNFSSSSCVELDTCYFWDSWTTARGSDDSSSMEGFQVFYQLNSSGPSCPATVTYNIWQSSSCSILSSVFIWNRSSLEVMVSKGIRHLSPASTVMLSCGMQNPQSLISSPLRCRCRSISHRQSSPDLSNCEIFTRNTRSCPCSFLKRNLLQIFSRLAV